jgi:dolichyl-phosphate beta-glucosyltransferase
MQKTLIVVPCYNEERRINKDQLLQLLDRGDNHVLFVDDGSTDRTWEFLEDLRKTAPARIHCIRQSSNQGKGEAVRKGFLWGIDGGFDVLGYLDADCATPASEANRLCQYLREHPDVDCVIGSRIKMLGRKVERRAFRHYTGRIFATMASIVLDEAIYDTQCGAKCFRSDFAIRQAVSQPFLSRWAFDVELLGRYFKVNSSARTMEMPLNTWVDKTGSRMGLLDSIIGGFDLLRIYLALKRWNTNASERP